MIKRLRIVSLVLATSLLFSSVSFAVVDKTASNQIKEEKEFYKAIKMIEKKVVRNEDGTFEFEKDLKISGKYFDSISQGMSEINSLILDGYLETDDNLRVYSNEKYVLKGNNKNNKAEYVKYDVFFEEFTKNNSIEVIEIGDSVLNIDIAGNTSYADSYSPPVGLYFYWWGWNLAIDNDTTLDLIDLMNVGAGASAIAGLLAAEGIISSPAALPLGITSGVLWIGSAVINFTNRHGGYKGVYFRGLYSVPPVYYIWARS